MRILVVDNSEDGRDVAEAMLLAAGYDDVSTVGSAAEAYRFLAIGEPATLEPSPVDLVLLDIMMPEIDGIEACARIRKDEHHADVPIIMVTSLSDMDSLGNAFVAGATDYITKPLNRIELLARVRSALKLKSELDRRRAREHELLQFMFDLGRSPCLALDRRCHRSLCRRGRGGISDCRSPFHVRRRHVGHCAHDRPP